MIINFEAICTWEKATDLAPGHLGPMGPLGPIGRKRPMGPMGSMGTHGAHRAHGAQGAHWAHGTMGSMGAHGVHGGPLGPRARGTQAGAKAMFNKFMQVNHSEKDVHRCLEPDTPDISPT